MDSRLIFESSKTYSSKIAWEKTKYPDSEWTSISIDNILASEQAYLLIVNHFDTEILHVSIVRNNSFTTSKNLVVDQIKELINRVDFHVWNEHFTRTIEFNKIGVFRLGKTG